MTDELFIKAARKKFRFPSKVGMLNVENLWDLPLTSANKASLDDTARTTPRLSTCMTT